MNTRTTGRRRSSATGKASTEARLLKLTKKVNALDPELKCYQAAGAFTNVDDATGQINYLTAIAQGTTIQERIGDKIQIKELFINVKLLAGAVASAASTALYGVYLIRDMQSSGVLPVVSGTAQSIFAFPGPVQAVINPVTKDRFKIVRKFVFGGGMAAGGNQLPLCTFKVKLNHVIDWHDGTTAITGAGKNAYYLVLLSDDTNDTVDFATYLEIRFTDA